MQHCVRDRETNLYNKFPWTPLNIFAVNLSCIKLIGDQLNNSILVNIGYCIISKILE